MASRDAEDGLLWLLGLWLVAEAFNEGPRAVKRAVVALEDAGARARERVSNLSYDRDLPGKRLTKAQLIALATRTGFASPRVAAAVALAESGGYPGILGDNRRSVGLWQINLDHHPEFIPERLVDPEANARAAYDISDGGTNWQWWTTFRSGAYRSFL